MTLSFRTRLALVATLTVAVALAVVLAVVWIRVLDFEVAQLDVRLCQEARRLATQHAIGRERPGLVADLVGKLRLSGSERLWYATGGADSDLRQALAGWAPEVDSGAPDWSPQDPWSGGATRQDRPRRRRGECAIAGVSAAGRDWRVARFQAQEGNALLAADLADTRGELAEATRSALKLGIPVALTLSLLGAWLLSGLMLRPLRRLRDSMGTLTQRDLGRRLPSHGEDREFRALIEAYNVMLERLDASFQQASRFSADAAHELKTPLTILQGRIERAIAQADGRAIQADLGGMLDEVGRLSAITRKLLLLAQADAGRMALQRTRVDLSQLLDDMLADARMLQEGSQVSGEIARALVVDGDALLLRQLCNNLIGNALRHGAAPGWVRVDARLEGPWVEVEFSNLSREIPPEERAHLFERFYRGDPAHGRATGGSGLGLSLALEIARAHGGELELLPSPADRVHLRLRLPGAVPA